MLPAARPVDHLVLPTSSLDAARARLSALGFTVAPMGLHPFGTANACVYFSDGTFLEPLAVADASRRDAAIAGGNVFVARDRDFRDRFGEEGFSAIVLASRDAAADHAAYAGARLSAGDMLAFSRPFLDAAGRSDTASFRLAFAAAPGAVPYVFACERVNAPAVDRSALERHPNGVTRLRAVTVLAAETQAAADFLAAATGAVAEPTAGGIRLDLPNLRLAVVDAAVPGSALPAGERFSFTEVAFGVSDLAALRARLDANGVECAMRGSTLAVPRRPGQGATFLFEETT